MQLSRDITLLTKVRLVKAVVFLVLIYGCENWTVKKAECRKKMLAPWKKSYDKLNILKRRDITLQTNVHIVNAMVFPVVMYGCESWTIKKAEHQTIDAFELLRRLLRVSQTARRSN